MGLSNDGKLNQLLKGLPEGVAASSAWLKARGVSAQLARKYVMSAWLSKLGRGSYALPGSPVKWQGALLGLSRLDGLELHIGGISALNRSGDGHYLPLGGEAAIHVWCGRKLPSWVGHLHLQPALKMHYTKLFHDSVGQTGLTMMPTGVRDWQLPISTPERAIMEVLSEVDATPGSFVYASELFEGLTVLRPAMIQQLLAGCTRVKVKRLFLFLATYHRHPWLQRIDVSAIDTGSGKRQIVKGGHLDKAFQITVPESFIVN
jgi:hypothetical protein